MFQPKNQLSIISSYVAKLHCLIELQLLNQSTVNHVCSQTYLRHIGVQSSLILLTYIVDLIACGMVRSMIELTWMIRFDVMIL